MGLVDVHLIHNSIFYWHPSMEHNIQGTSHLTQGIIWRAVSGSRRYGLRRLLLNLWSPADVGNGDCAYWKISRFSSRRFEQRLLLQNWERRLLLTTHQMRKIILISSAIVQKCMYDVGVRESTLISVRTCTPQPHCLDPSPPHYTPRWRQPSSSMVEHISTSRKHHTKAV